MRAHPHGVTINRFSATSRPKAVFGRVLRVPRVGMSMVDKILIIIACVSVSSLMIIAINYALHLN